MRTLSAQGKAACAASGYRNLAALQEGRENGISGAKAASELFEATLREDLGEKLTAWQEACLMAACASYAALYLLQRRLKTARNFRRVQALAEALPGVTSNLIRALRALGLDSGNDGDTDEPARGGIADWQRAQEARKEEAANAPHP